MDINPTIVKECNFDVLLTWLNSTAGQQYAIKQNKNVVNAFPVTKYFLQNYYSNSSFTGYKKSYNDINCAADVVSYFLVTYGFTPGSTTGGAGAAEPSSGLNPLFGATFNAGFDWGNLPNYLLYLLIGVVAYKVITKE